MILPYIIIYTVNYIPISSANLFISHYQTISMNAAYTQRIVATSMSVLNLVVEGNSVGAQNAVNLTAEYLQDAEIYLSELRDLTTNLKEIQTARYASAKLIQSVEDMNTVKFCNYSL